MPFNSQPRSYLYPIQRSIVLDDHPSVSYAGVSGGCADAAGVESNTGDFVTAHTLLIAHAYGKYE